MASEAVRIDSAGVTLDGDLDVPVAASGIVVFAHGSGSSRHSLRNREVAASLQQAGYATLLMDLLTPDEERIDERTRELRFDVALLGERVVGALDWLAGQQGVAPPGVAELPVALFGASTGAAATLIAAAQRPDRVRLVISRGGRPDLAGAALPRVQAPTLLIVGGADTDVLRLNEDAASQMRTDVSLEVVPRATHLFPEPGAMAVVTDLAISALQRRLSRTDIRDW